MLTRFSSILKLKKSQENSSFMVGIDFLPTYINSKYEPYKYPNRINNSKNNQ